MTLVQVDTLETTFSASGIAEARMLAVRSGRSMIEVLESTATLNGADFVAKVAQVAHLQALDMGDLHALQPAFETLTFQLSTQHQCLPLRNASGELLLVVADPFQSELIDWAMERLQEPFQLYLAHRTDIQAYLSRHEESMRAMDGEMFSLDGLADTFDADVEHLSLQSISADASPVIRLVNSTLYDALKSGASDIHLESVASGLVIKYRIDGVLSQVGAMQGAEMAEQAVSRIKVLSELDIAERRVPQDGRFKVVMQGRDVDFRVSIMPSNFGEDAVLRSFGHHLGASGAQVPLARNFLPLQSHRGVHTWG